MKYFFIFNGLPDRKWAMDEVCAQIKALGLDCVKYVTTAPGDATRFVNLHCDLNPKEEDCFVAVGGAGTTNEVTSAIVGRENKYLAILSYGGTNDFTKMYPDYDFTDVRKLLQGTMVKVDAIRVNDNYALNSVGIGLDAMVTLLSRDYLSRNESNPYSRAVTKAVLKYRFHRIRISADGVQLNRGWITSGQLGNGKYFGGEFLGTPNAVVDDGLIELSFFKPMGLLTLAYVMPRFKKGIHLDNPFCKRYLTYVRAKHVELRSKDLITMTIDGEIIAAESVDADIMPGAVNLILPKL